MKKVVGPLLMAMLISSPHYAQAHEQIDYHPEADFNALGNVYGFGKNLYRVDTASGALTFITGNVDGTIAATFYDSYFYGIRNGNLILVHPEAGGNLIYERSGFEGGLATLNGKLYTIKNGSLAVIYGGSAKTIGSPSIWKGTTSLTASGNRIYIIQNNRLHSVKPEDGSYTVLGGADWKGFTSMQFYYGSLYIVQNGTLHRVDPSTGSWEVLGTVGDWAGTTSMTAADGFLYISQRNTLHKVRPDGSWQVIGEKEKTERLILVSRIQN